STLWLQILHPDVFGGVWSISPDPVDFRDFSGPDLTLSSPGNFYHDPSGHTYMIQREHGRDYRELRWLATREPWGIAQFDSFEEVFSPRGSDGKAKQLFDRHTGDIDPAVAQYWELHWDIDRRLRDRWLQDGAQLRGKIHIFVGTDDTFHLDGPVHRMDDELKELNADAHVTFVPGANHWSIFDYQHDLVAEIIREMTEALPPMKVLK
ncbi:MAG: enterochelin esterase, partial [Candidatus Eremiobacteraeota bacterium]|nr:enterochelin esterase [Candidatus Eremiobacteraeota bacterium]